MKRNLLRLGGLLLGSMMCQAIDLAGTLPGEIVVDNTGSATYAIPLNVLPGTGGMKPELSLMYSSRGGNGTMGLGWSMAGLSKIVRGGQNLFYDEAVTAVEMTVDGTTGELSDRFSLDGQRLVDVDTDNMYWKSTGTQEYRTAVESFSRIRALGVSGNGPASFTVETKDGHKMTYGNTTISPNSRLILNGSVFSWMLSRIEDTLGNYIDFQYRTDLGTNSPVIDYIDYTGNTAQSLTPYNRIKFYYKTSSPARPDVNSIYVLGNELKLNAYLDFIIVQDGDLSGTPTNQWEYHFNYKTNTSTESPFLKLESIQYKLVDGPHEFLPQTEIVWSGATGTPVLVDTNPGTADPILSAWVNPEDEKLISQVSDFDNDGEPELLNVYRSSEYDCTNGVDMIIELYELGTGVPVLSDTYTVDDLGCCAVTKVRMAVGDFDGDGKSDLYFLFDGFTFPSTSWNFRMFEIDPSQTNRITYVHSQSIPINTTSDESLRTMLAGDYDGDGKSELFAFYAKFSNNDIDLKVYTNPMTDTSQVLNLYHNGSYGRNELSYSTGDVNGDGRTDFIMHVDGREWDAFISGMPNENESLWVAFKHENGNLLYDIDNDGSATVIDINGDGHLDYIDTREISNKTRVQIYRGTGVIDAGNEALEFENSPWLNFEVYDQYHLESKTLFLDYDGDGLTDIGYVPRKSSNTDDTDIRLFRNTGNGFTYVSTYAIIEGLWHSRTSISAVDLNSDGASGLVSFYRSGNDKRVDFTKNTAPRQNLISSITNGMGLTTEIDFSTLVDDTVYEPGHRFGYPFKAVVDAISVVSAIRKDTGLRDSSGDPILHESWFMYAEGRSHMRGLGFLGFEQFESYDPQRQMSRTEIVEQAFPMTGMVKYTASHYWGSGPVVRDSTTLPRSQRQNSETQNLDRFILNETESIVVCDAVSGGTMFSMITHSEETNWELYDTRQPDTFNTQNKRFYPASGVTEISKATTQTWFDNQSQTSPVTTLPNAIAIDSGDPLDWVMQAKGLGDESYDTERSYFPIDIKWGNAKKVFVDYHSEGMTTTTLSNYINESSDPAALGNWFLGRLSSSSTTQTKTNYSNVVKSVDFAYDATTGLLGWERTLFGAGETDPRTNKTRYEHDAFGNILKEWKEGHFELVNGSPTTWTSYESRQVMEREMDSVTHRFVVKEYGPMSLQNSKSFWTSYGNFNAFGVPESVTDVNGFTGVTDYDGLGREISVDAPVSLADTTVERIMLSTPITFYYSDSNYTLPKQTAVMAKITKTASGSSAYNSSIEYFDAVGRVILERKDIYGSPSSPLNATQSTTNETYSYKVTFYNADGNLVAASGWSDQVALSGTTIVGLDNSEVIWSINEFDQIGRVTAAVAGYTYNSNASAVRTEYVFDGQRTEVTINEDANTTDTQYNQKSEILKDALGRDYKTTRFFGTNEYVVENHYDVSGNLVEVERHFPNSMTTSTTFTYDDFGQKASMVDPELGTWTYVYNFLGQLLYQKDAKNNITLLKYDHAGNLVERNRNGNMDYWVYEWNITADNPVGSLANTQQEYGPEVDRYYGYNPSTGQLDIEWARIENIWYYKTYGYDNYLRPTVVGHYWKPDGDTNYSLSSDWHPYLVENVYDSKGFVTEVLGYDTTTGYTTLSVKSWWKLKTGSEGYDDKGRVDAFTLGNGIDTDLSYDLVDGTIEMIETDDTSGLILQKNEYDFDKMGRLILREENEQERESSSVYWHSQRSEDFGYDALNRVTLQNSSTVATYDVYGNVTSHTYQPGGYGLVYNDSTRRTRLTNANGAGIYYDNNGNITWQYRASLGGWVQYSWNNFNKLSSAYGSSTDDLVEFEYDGADNLAVQARSDTNGYIEKKLYLMGYEQSYEYSSGWVLDYTRIKIGAPTGVVGTYTWPGDTQSGSGYRHYLHYDHQGSVNMVTNDSEAVVQRFSYDGFGGERRWDVWGGQSSSYIADNVRSHGNAGDISYTGHESIEDFDLIHMGGRVYDPGLARFLSPDPIVQSAGDTQNYNRYSYVLNNPLSNTDPSGYFIQLIPALLYAAGVIGIEVAIIATVVLTFAVTLAMGGSLSDAFKAALISGAAMFVGYQIGGIFQLDSVTSTVGSFVDVAKAAAHGLSSGGFAELSGGDFGSGFLSGFVGSLGNGYIEAHMDIGPGAFVASAIVGGTASELGGGKFANGAITSVMIFAVNDLGRHGGSTNEGEAKTVAETETQGIQAQGEQSLTRKEAVVWDENNPHYIEGEQSSANSLSGKAIKTKWGNLLKNWRKIFKGNWTAPNQISGFVDGHARISYTVDLVNANGDVVDFYYGFQEVASGMSDMIRDVTVFEVLASDVTSSIYDIRLYSNIPHSVIETYSGPASDQIYVDNLNKKE